MKNTNTIVLTLLAAALFVAGYFPVFQKLIKIWLTSEEYSHAFVILPFVLYMVWTKKNVLLDAKLQYAPFGLFLVVLATACYFFAMLTQVNTLIFLSLFLTVLGVLIYLAGIKSVQELFAPLILLLLLIPVPEQLYIKLTFPLQLKVSQISEIIVGMFGVPILREGNVMTIAEKSFEVVEACSGLRSIISLVTLSVILGYFMLERNISRIILVLASVPTAIIVNIIRVSSMILLYHFFRLDLSVGILHTLTGLLIVISPLILFFFLYKVWNFGK